jgi:membrane fusion protein (multidrug efflux system)
MEERSRGDNNRKKKAAFLVFFIVLVAGAVVGAFYIRYKQTHISTDDAFVEGTIHTIASKVSGTVLKVYVKDNQWVKEGELLLELDPELYIQALRKAEAALEAEKKRLYEIKTMIQVQKEKIRARGATLRRAEMARQSLLASLKAQEADLLAKKALLQQAEADLRRAKNLYKKGVIPKDRYEKAETAYSSALAAMKASQALKTHAEVSLRAQESTIQEAEAALRAEKAVLLQLEAAMETQSEKVKTREAALETARLKLSYVKVYSPSDGYITKKAVDVGEQIQAGQPLMAVVPLRDLYIVANYKETKIRKIKPGMRVKIKVDAYPDKTFWGRVDSIMAGTGAVFSLFPPENATGNYVKVVQRIPVKILLEDGADPEHVLRIGMSVVPTVLVK